MIAVIMERTEESGTGGRRAGRGGVGVMIGDILVGGLQGSFWKAERG